MIILLLFPLFLGGQYCSHGRKVEPQPSRLLGFWCAGARQLSSDYETYGSAHFLNDSIVVFGSIGDTIYRYKYIADSWTISISEHGRFVKTLFYKFAEPDQLWIGNFPLHQRPIVYYRRDPNTGCP